jgi:plasmid stability protein
VITLAGATVSQYHSRMPNITLTLDEDTYRAARIKAAEAGTSVSALVRDYLISLTQADARFAALLAQEETLRAGIQGFDASDRLPRETLHRGPIDPDTA